MNPKFPTPNYFHNNNNKFHRFKIRSSSLEYFRYYLNSDLLTQINSRMLILTWNASESIETLFFPKILSTYFIVIGYKKAQIHKTIPKTQSWSGILSIP